MNHQPFETWLFDPKKLTKEQLLELHNHLEKCTRCQQMAAAWQMVEKQIKSAPPAIPAAGFSDRWRKNLPAWKAEHHKEEGRGWLIGLSSGAAVSLLALIVLNANVQSVTTIAGSVANLYQRSSVIFNQIRNFIFILANTVPSYVWTILIVALSSWLLIGGLIWLYAINKIRKGVVRNESRDKI
jgi:hypothetical protein